MSAAAEKSPRMDAPTDMLIVKTPSSDSPPSTLKSRSSGGGNVGGGGTTTSGILDDEESAVLLLGCVQVGLGVLMAACGVLALVHEAALAPVGAGLWGGAVAMAAGVVGVLAGLRGCYSVHGAPAPTGLSSVATTAFLALCLLSLAISNLVLVLAVTGLVRDTQRPQTARILLTDKEELIESEEGIDWPPILSNCGLLVVSALHCLIAIVSIHRCYRRVCPCASRRPLSSHSDESLEQSGSFYSTSSKERLISSWLGQQPGFHRSNMVLIPQPTLPGPIFTLPHPPQTIPAPSVINYHFPGPRYINPLAQPRYVVRRPTSHLYGHTGRSKRKQYAADERRRRRSRENRPSQKRTVDERPVTEEEVAKTYTGLDREIAEEFIAIAMEPGVGRERQARTNSDALSDGQRDTL
ncbi:uncharacterized protein [Anabrus simplex]|uniref:uncharacterized protein n=1 Tax=Anabrus simplex TaxID=316456 RepID=UPI0035A31CE3